MRLEVVPLALIEGCKHSIEVTIPAEAVAAEIEKVTEKVRSQARIQGFRPGKAPASIIRARYGSEIRQEALENLIPKYLEEACERENLRVVSRPTIKDLHFHEGEAVHFRHLPCDFGLVHYASDTPYTRARTLGGRSLSFEGIDSTYAASVAILRRVLSQERRRPD